MAGPVRKRFQGVTNIIHFNTHYYTIYVVSIIALGMVSALLPDSYATLIWELIGVVFIVGLLSVVVSWYVYDYSGMYDLKWLDSLGIKQTDVLVNINAGFDETSEIIHYKYPLNKLVVFDFYNPETHTELSIKKARKAYPAYKNTQTITTTTIPLDDNSAGVVLLIMAAHEIRNEEERLQFFINLRAKLKPGGTIVVIEHLRNVPNFIAFNFGAFHFYSATNWRNLFNNAGLRLAAEHNLNLFVKQFILKK